MMAVAAARASPAARERRMISHSLVISKNLGTRVIYITGNHDEALRKYSDFVLGNFELVDKLILEIDGKKTWFFHGDVFDSSTRGYAKILAKLGGKLSTIFSLF